MNKDLLDENISCFHICLAFNRYVHHAKNTTYMLLRDCIVRANVTITTKTDFFHFQIDLFSEEDHLFKRGIMRQNVQTAK